MKTKYILLCLLGLVLLKPVNAQWQKLALSTVIPNASYMSIHFVSDSVGFISGCDNPSSWNSKGVFRTMDAGNSWTLIQGGSGGDCKITHAFADKNTGFSIISYGTLQPNDLLKTNDGGATWQHPDTSNSANMGALSFTGPMHFVNSNLGFISKDDTVFRTTNGGKSWQKAPVSGALNAFAFTSSQTGFAAGDKRMLRTTDGGNSWNNTTTLYDIRALSFPSANTGYAVGAKGIILKTTDSGTSWQPQSSGLPNTITLNSVFCLNSNVCYAVGDAGTIVNTTDGGATWTQQSSGVKVNLNSVSCTNQHCYAVGDTTALLRTGNITGIDNYDRANEVLSLFPNPAHSEIVITTSSTFKHTSVVLYTAQGAEVKRSEGLDAKEVRITRGNLASGIYFAHIQQDNKVLSVHKVIFTD